MNTRGEVESIAFFIAAILVLSYLFGQFLEFVDWQIRRRRMWRNIRKRIQQEQRW